jgi:CDP-diacylglycerol pyrophosphatase
MNRRVVALLLAVLASLAACSSPSRTVLWEIVSTCLDPDAPGYCQRCRVPLAGNCSLGRPCEKTTAVWEMSDTLVAIRDIKMCGCPAGFIHGLAVPRAPVTGVEDPRRPAGIWQFAWDVATERVADSREIALAVNPPDDRSQDQLHVHLVRLQPGARARIIASAPARVRRLDDVWETAARRAAELGLPRYGVLVIAAEDRDSFLVLPSAASPEREYTVSRCR